MQQKRKEVTLQQQEQREQEKWLVWKLGQVGAWCERELWNMQQMVFAAQQANDLRSALAVGTLNRRQQEVQRSAMQSRASICTELERIRTNLKTIKTALGHIEPLKGTLRRKNTYLSSVLELLKGVRVEWRDRTLEKEMWKDRKALRAQEQQARKAERGRGRDRSRDRSSSSSSSSSSSPRKRDFGGRKWKRALSSSSSSPRRRRRRRSSSSSSSSRSSSSSSRRRPRRSFGGGRKKRAHSSSSSSSSSSNRRTRRSRSDATQGSSAAAPAPGRQAERTLPTRTLPTTLSSCRYFARKGTCPWGEKCHFVHGEDEQRRIRQQLRAKDAEERDERERHDQAKRKREMPAAGESGADAVVKMRGLPYKATRNDILDFFSGLSVPLNGVHLMFNEREQPTGEAYVELASADDRVRAMTKNQQRIGGRYIELFRVGRAEMLADMRYGPQSAVKRAAERGDAPKKDVKPAEKPNAPPAPAYPAVGTSEQGKRARRERLEEEAKEEARKKAKMREKAAAEAKAEAAAEQKERTVPDPAEVAKEEVRPAKKTAGTAARLSDPGKHERLERREEEAKEEAKEEARKKAKMRERAAAEAAAAEERETKGAAGSGLPVRRWMSTWRRR
jgi:hypothetical protein